MTTTPESWVDDNWQTVKCLSMTTADALFSTYMAVSSYEPGGIVWWKYGYDALTSVAQLFACTPPPITAFETAFDGDSLRCQCAQVGGQLFIEYLDSTGTRVEQSESELVEAKEIQTATESGGVATCTWNDVDGLTITTNFTLSGGTQPVWYIVPTLDTGCCINSPVIPSVQPQPPPHIIPGTCTGPFQETVTLIDSAIDRFGLLQNYYFVQLPSPGCSYFQYEFYYWETITGPVRYGVNQSFEGLYSNPPYAPPHPHAAEPTVNLSKTNPGLSAVTYTLDVGCTYNPLTLSLIHI